MVTLIFIADPRSGQVQVKKVIFRNSKFSFQNIPTLSSFVSVFQKNVICFDVQQLQMPNIAFQKVPSSPLTGFWAIAQPKKDVALKPCMRVVSMHLHNMYSLF